MSVTEIDGQQYISVDEARQLLGLGYKDMARLLEARALRFRRDLREQTIQWILAEDVQDAIGYRERQRYEERQRRSELLSDDRGEEAHYTFLASDLTALLLAAVCYFDAERDIYLGGFDERGDINKTVQAVFRIYTWLERESKAGRSISEIVMEIYEQRPDERARYDIFFYLMNKTKRK